MLLVFEKSRVRTIVFCARVACWTTLGVVLGYGDCDRGNRR